MTININEIDIQFRKEDVTRRSPGARRGPCRASDRTHLGATVCARIEALRQRVLASRGRARPHARTAPSWGLRVGRPNRRAVQLTGTLGNALPCRALTAARRLQGHHWLAEMCMIGKRQRARQWADSGGVKPTGGLPQPVERSSWPTSSRWGCQRRAGCSRPQGTDCGCLRSGCAAGRRPTA